MNFRFACYLILLALPLYGIRFSIAGQPTHLLELLVLAVLAAYVFSRRGTLKRPEATDLSGWRMPAALLFLAATIALFVSPNFPLAFASYRQYYLEPMLFFVMLSREFHGIEDVKKLLLALSIPTVPIALVAFAQHFDLYPIPAAYLADHRSTSLYSYANAVGLYLAPVVGVIGAWWMVIGRHETPTTNHKSPITYFLLISALLSLIAICFAQTEAAELALVATALIAGFSFKRSRRATLGVVVLGMLVLALRLPLAETVINKLTLQDFSGAVRRTIWSETAGMLKDHWLFGAGLAGYQTVMIPYHFQKDIEIFWYPHTLLLNIWVELGLLGLYAFLRITRSAYRQLQNVLPHHRWIVIAPLLVMLLHGLFDVPFFKPDLALLTAAILSFSVILRADQDDQAV